MFQHNSIHSESKKGLFWFLSAISASKPSSYYLPFYLISKAIKKRSMPPDVFFWVHSAKLILLVPWWPLLYTTSFRTWSALPDTPCVYLALACSDWALLTSPVAATLSAVCDIHHVFAHASPPPKPHFHCFVSDTFSPKKSWVWGFWSFQLVLCFANGTFSPVFPCVESLPQSFGNRHDESSSHPDIGAGWTHGASQGQRQPQALPGIWGERANGFKCRSFFRLLNPVWLCFHETRKQSSRETFLHVCVCVGRAPWCMGNYWK